MFVADPTFGDILNFNVGQLVDLDVPRVGGVDWHDMWLASPGVSPVSTLWSAAGDDYAILYVIIWHCSLCIATRPWCVHMAGSCHVSAVCCTLREGSNHVTIYRWQRHVSLVCVCARVWLAELLVAACWTVWQQVLLVGGYGWLSVRISEH